MKKDNLLYITELVLLFFLGISQVLSISFISITITFIIMILFAINRIEKVFLMLFIALPFFNLFNSNIGETSLYYIFIIIFLIKYFIYKKGKISKGKIIIMLIFMLSRLFSNDMYTYIKWLLPFSVLILTYGEDFFTQQIKLLVNCFGISFLISSCIGFYMLNHGISIYTNSYVYTANVGKTIRFAGLIGDSVFYGQFSALINSALLVIAFYSKNNKLRFLISIVILGFTLLSYSKTGLFLNIFAYFTYFILYIINNIRNKKDLIRVFFILITFCIILSVTFYWINKSNSILVKNYMTRFTSNDLLTGRSDITQHYIKLLKSRWTYIFVAMPQSIYYTYFNTTHGVNLINRSHNIYIETICAFGMILAVLSFIYLIKKCFYFIKRKKDYICLLPIMVMIISGFFLHGHFEFQYYFLLALSIAFLDNDIIDYIKEKN